MAYIDRDVAIEVAYKIIRNSLHIPNGAKGAEFLEAENAIEAIPAADVRPVVRGKWLPKNEIGDCCYQCSDCGFVRDAYILDIGNFCPNCGADMRPTSMPGANEEEN